MKRAKQMRKLGRRCFILAAILLCLFGIGMVTLPEGGYAFEELPALVQFSLVLGGLALAASVLLVVGAEFSRVFANRKLQANGIEAEAKILKIWQTGTEINNSPVVGMLLEVRPPGEPPFEAETERLISILNIPSIQPGAVVHVKYDPESREVALMEARDA